MKRIVIILAIWGLAVALFSGVTIAPAQAAAAAKAVAVLHPTQGNASKGTVYFYQTNQGIRVVAEVTGLIPGLHGFHIHQFGDCSAPDGKSAGGHFNPMAEQHAGPVSEQRHIGDLGNLSVGNDGSAHYDRVDSHLQLSGSNSIVGRAVIVHAKPDDLNSQPTGNAGPRMACGVIGIISE